MPAPRDSIPMIRPETCKHPKKDGRRRERGSTPFRNYRHLCTPICTHQDALGTLASVCDLLISFQKAYQPRKLRIAGYAPTSTVCVCTYTYTCTCTKRFSEPPCCFFRGYSEFRVQGFGLRAQGSGLRAQGSGLRVKAMKVLHAQAQHLVADSVFSETRSENILNPEPRTTEHTRRPRPVAWGQQRPEARRRESGL